LEKLKVSDWPVVAVVDAHAQASQQTQSLLGQSETQVYHLDSLPNESGKRKKDLLIYSRKKLKRLQKKSAQDWHSHHLLAHQSQLNLMRHQCSGNVMQVYGDKIEFAIHIALVYSRIKNVKLNVKIPNS
jgi:hypothetical protein